MATQPNKIIYPQAQKTAQAIATAAKTTYNDATNAVLLATAGADGAIVVGIAAIARATVADTQLQLYISPDAGVTLYLVATAKMPATTMAASAQMPTIDFGYSASAPLRLAATNRLYVGIGVALAGGIAFNCQYQDY